MPVYTPTLSVRILLLAASSTRRTHQVAHPVNRHESEHVPHDVDAALRRPDARVRRVHHQLARLLKEEPPDALLAARRADERVEQGALLACCAGGVWGGDKEPI